MGARVVFLAVGLFVGCQAATQAFAWIYQDAPALGRAWRAGADLVVYPPWSIFVWRARFSETAQQAFTSCSPLILLGAFSGLWLGSMLEAEAAVRRIRGWGRLADAKRAGLAEGAGCVLGAGDGARHADRAGAADRGGARLFPDAP